MFSALLTQSDYSYVQVITTPLHSIVYPIIVCLRLCVPPQPVICRMVMIVLMIDVNSQGKLSFTGATDIGGLSN